MDTAFVESDWTIAAIVTPARHELIGLIKGKIYSFRVAAATPTGTSDY